MKWTRFLAVFCIALVQLTFVASKKVTRVNRRQVIAQSLQRQVLLKSKFKRGHGTERRTQIVESSTSTKKPTTSTKKPTTSTKAPKKKITKTPKKKSTKEPKKGKGIVGAATTSSGNKKQTLTKIASSAVAMILWFYL